MQYVALCKAKAKTRSNTISVVEDMIQRESKSVNMEKVKAAAATVTFKWQDELTALGCPAPYSNCSFTQYRAVCKDSSIELLPARLMSANESAHDANNASEEADLNN